MKTHKTHITLKDYSVSGEVFDKLNELKAKSDSEDEDNNEKAATA